MIELDGHRWHGELSPEYGGNLCGLSYDGFELLRKPLRESDLGDTPVAYGIPVLFPPNRIANGEFRFDGRRYRLPLNEPERGNHLHGMALLHGWRVAVREASVAELRFAHPATEDFPAEFELRLRYELQPAQLVQTLTVVNCGRTAMPCGIGFHTAFRSPRRARVETAGVFREILPPRHLPSGRLLPWGEFDPGEWFSPEEERLSCQFPAPPGSHAAELEYDSMKFRYEVDPKFREWCLWNGGGHRGFFCPEPMSWPTDAPNHSGDIPRVPAGESLAFRSRIIIAH